MVLLLLVGLVVFFIAGYQLHNFQYQELVAESKQYANDAKKAQADAKEQIELTRFTQVEINQQIVAMNANDQERAKRHALLIEENSMLKSQLFLLQRNCTCGGLKRDVPK